MIRLIINGEDPEVDMEADTPLLWALCDGLHLNGTKYGCAIAQCGACIVLTDVQPVRSLPIRLNS